MATNSVPGISLAVVQDGALVWSRGFGMADLENFVPATSATLFRLGSISKPITATAILQLSERGKVDLDVEVQNYCRAFPKKEWPVTTRELLGHLGGIRHYNPDGKGDIPEDSAKHFLSMEESLQVFAGDPLVAKPGTKFHYSTYGYTVLGCILEGAASEKCGLPRRPPMVPRTATRWAGAMPRNSACRSCRTPEASKHQHIDSPGAGAERWNRCARQHGRRRRHGFVHGNSENRSGPKRQTWIDERHVLPPRRTSS